MSEKKPAGFSIDMNASDFVGSMDGLMVHVIEKARKAGEAAESLRLHLLAMNLKVTIGVGGSFGDPGLIIYRERKVIPPVIKELVKTGWEGHKVHTAYLGKIVIKPDKK